MSKIIQKAINSEMNAALAEKIYFIAYPNTDDKRFRQSKISEITDWLDDGDPEAIAGNSEEQLAAEWLEYDVSEEREEE